MSFALFLFLSLVLTGLVALADRFHFAGKRAEGEREPWWIEYSKSFFPVILIVFALRSFVIEPFRIPSGSMIPTLLVGDFILVNKYTYGLRLPILNKKILQVNDPRRGDVMVFRYPEDRSLDYIKRVVGVPGDTIAYRNKRLFINSEAQPTEEAGQHLHAGPQMVFSPRYVETLNGVKHHILNDRGAPKSVPNVHSFPGRGNCSYDSEGFVCKVPPGHYFMMGDNRDNSEDSRVWGFVPDENIVGKAFFIWFNLGDLGRIGSFQ
jgi:signal peptidase I